MTASSICLICRPVALLWLCAFGILPAHAAERGMTWGAMTEVPTLPNVVYASCHGTPKAATHNGSCNAYAGDTPCTQSLPLLCIKVDNRKRPDYLYEPQIKAALPSSFYAGWAGQP
jgi:hypothetical protein